MGCPDENTLADFAAGQLSADREALLDEHLDRCTPCRRLAYALPSQSDDGSPLCGDAATIAGTLRARIAESADPLTRFELRGKLGGGGMGIVYDAWDTRLRRQVALKVIRLSQRSTSAETAGAQAVAEMRLLREARALARLSHPNVVGVYDVGVQDSRLYIAMELVDGTSLDAWLAAQPREWRDVVRTMEQAGRGLAAAHDAGLIHRDFKPQNVMVSSNGQVKVVDFGLVREALDDEPEQRASVDAASSSPDRIDDGRMTATGALLGTPAYTSPEQLDGVPATTQSDVFAFCATLFEALYGRRPFASKNIGELRDAIRRGAIDDSAKRRGSKALRKLVCAGLSENPKDRPRSMHEVTRVLHQAPRRMWSMAVAGLLAIAGGGTALYLAPQNAAAIACDDGSAELARVWNDARGERLRGATLSADGEPDAQAWRAVTAAIDAHTEAWVILKREACTTARRGDVSAVAFERQTQCFRGQLSRLDASLGVLETSTNIAYPTATIAALAESHPAECTDVPALLGLSAVPKDASALDEIDAITRTLAEANVHMAAASYDRAGALARQASQRAKDLGYRPTEALALATLGNVLFFVGRVREADDVYRQASIAAAAGGDGNLEASMLLQLARVAIEREQYVKAAERSQHARGVGERIGSPALFVADADLVKGSALYQQGKLNEALATLGLAMATVISVEQSGGARQDVEQMKSLLHEYIGLVSDSMGNREQALASHRAALAIREQLNGPQHPHTAMSLEYIADSLQRLDRPQQAQPLLARADTIRGGVPGADNAYQRELARAAAETNPALTIAHLERAVALAKSMYGDEHSTVIHAMMLHGHALLESGEIQRAERMLSSALDMDARTPSRDVGMTAYGLSGLAEAQVEHDVDAALATVAKLAQLDHPDATNFRVIASAMRAGLLFRQRKWSEVMETTQAALPTLRASAEFDVHDLAFVEFLILASQSELDGTPRRALTEARRLRDLYAAGPDPDAVELAPMDAWLKRHSVR